MTRGRQKGYTPVWTEGRNFYLQALVDAGYSREQISASMPKITFDALRTQLQKLRLKTRVEAGWTEDEVGQLRTLAAEKLTASQIANQLPGRSRNAVIAKAARESIELQSEEAVQRRLQISSRGERVEETKKPTESEREAALALRPLDSFEKFDPRMGSNQYATWTCQEVVSDPEDEEDVLCGEECNANEWFCDTHKAKS